MDKNIDCPIIKRLCETEIKQMELLRQGQIPMLRKNWPCQRKAIEMACV